MTEANRENHLPTRNGDEVAGGDGPRYRFRFDGAEFDESTLELRVGGVVLSVEPRPLEVLAHLLRYANEVVTKSELLQAGWDGRPAVENVLANAVSKLRKALGEQAGNRIVNVPRIGYRFTGAVERLVVGSTPPTALALTAGMAVPGRTSFHLVEPLADNDRVHVWLARRRKTGQERVFKFAYDANSLRNLKRECTLSRVLQQTFPSSTDFVPVCGANFSTAPYFIECEFVGTDLLQWAEQDGRLAAMPLTERLALFVAIARAVAAAHSVGIMHRDLKPANVLIRLAEGTWRPALTDFGSARVLDEMHLRAAGVTLMGLTLVDEGANPLLGRTLMYAPPELMAGKGATMQCDVYSLGVMLYQMVVGDLRQPLGTGWQREVGDELLVDDITAATEADATQRLLDVGQLLERLTQLEQRRAHRKHVAELGARSAAALADLRRRHARRPWVVALVMTLTLAVIGAVLQGQLIQRAKDNEVRERARAERVSDFLYRDVLHGPDMVTDNRTKPVDMIEVLRRAAKLAPQRFKDDALGEALVHRKLAETHTRLANLADARIQVELSRKLLEPIVSVDHPELLKTQFLLAWLLAWGLDFGNATPLLAQAEKAAGESALLQGTELAYLAQRARLELLMQQQQYRQSLPVAKRLLELAEGVFPGDLGLQLDARVRVADIYIELGQAELAEAVFSEVAKPPFSAKDARSKAWARRHAKNAEVALRAGNVQLAEQYARQTWEVLQTDEEPNGFYLAFAHYHLAAAYSAQGQFEKARVELQRAVPLMARAHGEDHFYVPNFQSLLGWAELNSGRPAVALGLFEKVAQWSLKHSAGGRVGAVTELGRARALVELGRGEEAMPALSALTTKRFADLGVFEPAAAIRLATERANAFLALGKRAEALQALAALPGPTDKSPVWPWEQRRLRRVQDSLGLNANERAVARPGAERTP